MTQQPASFETDRLFLRPTQEADADFILALMNSPKWLKFIGDRKIQTPEAAATFIREKMHPQLERLGYSNYTVTRQSDGQTLGSCGLYDREGVDGVDLGFAFLPEHEGQGYAYEAALCIKEAAVTRFGLSRLNAITLPANDRSRKLLERLGFEFSTMTRIPNDPEEVMLYILDT